MLDLVNFAVGVFLSGVLVGEWSAKRTARKQREETEAARIRRARQGWEQS